MYSLQPVCQQYAWGKVGSSSAVAQLAKLNNPEITIEEDQPYAELWMGAHVKAPSKLLPTGNLRDIEPDLPFLLKVLSVNKALSIQAHPNKTLAEELHTNFPEIYKDPNHKPEMCIAVTDFEGLCGFRVLEEINEFFGKVESLKVVTGVPSITNTTELKTAFSNLMRADKTLIAAELTKTLSQVSISDESLLGDLLHRLNKSYPGDVGCFVIYFLNRVLLSPGECMFLGANVPHAYLDGNCIECMACSDNVVRAGLTPKLIDVDTLVGMLEYVPSSATERKFKPKIDNFDKYVKEIYSPPVWDFAVTKYQGEGEIVVEKLDSSSVFLVTEGSCKVENVKVPEMSKFDEVSDLKKGGVCYMPKNVDGVKFTGCGDGFTVWRASANVFQ